MDLDPIISLTGAWILAFSAGIVITCLCCCGAILVCCKNCRDHTKKTPIKDVESVHRPPNPPQFYPPSPPKIPPPSTVSAYTPRRQLHLWVFFRKTIRIGEIAVNTFIWGRSDWGLTPGREDISSDAVYKGFGEINELVLHQFVIAAAPLWDSPCRSNTPSEIDRANVIYVDWRLFLSGPSSRFHFQPIIYPTRGYYSILGEKQDQMFFSLWIIFSEHPPATHDGYRTVRMANEYGSPIDCQQNEYTYVRNEVHRNLI